MMRVVYRLLLRLYPSGVRSRFGEEMLEVFDQAREDARAGGGGAYFRFCTREMAGLVANLISGENLMKHGRPLLYGALVGLVLGAVVGLAWQRKPYTSVALIRTVPSMIPDRFVPASNLSTDRILPGITELMLSRGNLTNIINTYNLYPVDRLRMPMNDVIQQMRRDVRVKPLQNDTIEISFTYADPAMTRKIAADIVSRIMSEHSRTRLVQALLTLEFMKDRTDAAAREWEAALVALRTAQRERRPAERLQLDADIARRRYEEVSAKLADADAMKNLEVRQQGPLLEVLDPASLPADWRPPFLVCALFGFMLGAALGWLAALAAASRGRPGVAEV